MALRGTLKDFALPDIFQLIGMQRKTGLLTLESDREAVTVLFENGMVVHADSSVRRLDDLLGNVLVRQGKLRKDTLEEALAKQKVSMQRLGYILTTHGYIRSEDLKEALSEQVQQIVFRIFRWKSGSYHFDPSTAVDYDRAHITPVSTDHILMEGIRRVDEWPIIEKRIPSLNVVFRPLVPLEHVRVAEEEAREEGSTLEAAFDGMEGKKTVAPPGQSDGVVLSRAEHRIYKLVNGKRSVSAIVDMTGLSDFDVCRVLFDFIDRRLIALAKQAEVAAEPPPTRLPAAKAPPPAVMRLVGPALLMVGVLGALLVSGAATFRVPSRPAVVASEIENVGRTADLARLLRVEAALRLYYLRYGRYPVSLEDMTRSSPALVSPDELLDREGRPFAYERAEGRVVLATQGGVVIERRLGPGATVQGAGVIQH